DDQQDPLVDGARALLDGHIMLDRRLAAKGHYPPIAILDSISRLMPMVSTPEHLQKANDLRRLLASYSASEDLIRIGAYQKGGDPVLDQAVALLPELNHFLTADSEGLCAARRKYRQASGVAELVPCLFAFLFKQCSTTVKAWNTMRRFSFRRQTRRWSEHVTGSTISTSGLRCEGASA